MDLPKTLPSHKESSKRSEHLQQVWAVIDLTGERPRLVCGHGPEVAEIALVADQHDDDVVVGVVPQLLQPALHVLVRQMLGYVVD